MQLLLSFLTISLFIFNSASINKNIDTTSPRIIDAYILVYDSIYNQPESIKGDYIILDMESYFFADTTYEDRQKMINNFNKYNKVIVNSSLFKLKEIGLVDKLGNLRLNGEILMIDCIDYTSYDNGIIIKAINYKSPIVAKFYTIKLAIENNEWILKSITLNGVA
ncbi:hypothetical protein [Clostridium sp. HCS.1]|uniref:hypothetical protein n=1 Tax=Clostridium sp. HCS.1 TaxID=3238594 RepID=UPI003A10200F